MEAEGLEGEAIEEVEASEEVEAEGLDKEALQSLSSDDNWVAKSSLSFEISGGLSTIRII